MKSWRPEFLSPEHTQKSRTVCMSIWPWHWEGGNGKMFGAYWTASLAE